MGEVKEIKETNTNGEASLSEEISMEFEQVEENKIVVEETNNNGETGLNEKNNKNGEASVVEDFHLNGDIIPNGDLQIVESEEEEELPKNDSEATNKNKENQEAANINEENQEVIPIKEVKEIKETNTNGEASL